MTATARITAQTTVANYTNSLASGVVANFTAHDLIQANNEEIAVLVPNEAGVYKPLTFIDQGGRERTALLNAVHNSIRLTGPLDFRFVKLVTENAVELTEFS